VNKKWLSKRRNSRVSVRSLGPTIRLTASLVLSYAVFVGTPPKNPNAATWPAWNVSVHSRGYADTKNASEYGSVITASAAFTRTPAISTVASPKSNCASPAGWLSGTNTSPLTRDCSATYRRTVTSLPA
jgi:hypothetical protein